MRTRIAVVLALAAGIGMGAGLVEGLHAQAKPPGYYVAEVTVTNQDAYAKEYLPKAQALVKASGGRYLAVGSAIPVEGSLPAPRVAILAFDNMDALWAWQNSETYKKNRKIGDQYATFRAFAIEGTAL